MEDGLAEAIDEGKIGPRDDPKVGGCAHTTCFRSANRSRQLAAA